MLLLNKGLTLLIVLIMLSGFYFLITETKILEYIRKQKKEKTEIIKISTPMDSCKKLCMNERGYHYYRQYTDIPMGEPCLGLILTIKNSTNTRRCCCYDDITGDTTTTTIPDTDEDEVCSLTSMECGVECSSRGYNLAECSDGPCPFDYDELEGDYGCSDSPPCDRCCCKYVEGTTTTTTTTWGETTTTTISGSDRCEDYMMANYGLPNTEYDETLTSSNCLDYAESMCDNGVSNWGWINPGGAWGGDSNLGCCGWECNPQNLFCGKSSGQHCYGYDVAYHTSTFDSTKCNSFPKMGGSDCLYDCVYKGLDNYDMHCWCWNKEPCESWEDCGSDGCYGEFTDCNDICSSHGKNSLGCSDSVEHCTGLHGTLFEKGDECASGANCCCEWSNLQEACSSYGYSNSWCANVANELVNWPDDCYYEGSSSLVFPQGDYLCGSYGEPGLDMRACCFND